jgi:2-haloacid dehalogenase
VTEGVVFDVLGTLLDLGRTKDSAELARTLHHATSFTLVEEFAPLSDLARAVDEKLPDRLARAKPYDDVDEALTVLADAGLPAYVLTNGSAAQTRELLRKGELLQRFADVFSVEDVRRYKPDPAAYAHAARAIGHPPSALTFVSAHGWDILGAAKAGYRPVWVERDVWPLPRPVPQLRAPDLVEAARLIVARRG